MLIALAVVLQIKIAHDMQMSNFVQIAQYYSRTFSIITVWKVRKSKLYDSGNGPLKYRSRPGRYGVCQGNGKLGGGKSCSGGCDAYGSSWSSGCEVHGPSTTATV